MHHFLAQSVKIGNESIQGPLTIPGVSGNITIADIINRVLLFLIPLSSVILLGVLIWGGYDFLLSEGNPEKIKSAQAKITTGIIGFVIIVFSLLITRVIAALFGFGGFL